jgi:hypothetical protein
MTGQDDLDSYALRGARAVVELQAKDDGLWVDPSTPCEALLQKALRELHRVIENDEPAVNTEPPDSLVDAAIALVKEAERKHYDYDWVFEGIDRLRLALPKERL